MRLALPRHELRLGLSGDQPLVRRCSRCRVPAPPLSRGCPGRCRVSLCSLNHISKKKRSYCGELSSWLVRASPRSCLQLAWLTTSLSTRPFVGIERSSAHSERSHRLLRHVDLLFTHVDLLSKDVNGTDSSAQRGWQCPQQREHGIRHI